MGFTYSFGLQRHMASHVETGWLLDLDKHSFGGSLD
jgi:hypothetical protein